MRTIETQIYTFAELSDKAKEKAISDYYNRSGFHWMDESCKSLLDGVRMFADLKNWSIDPECPAHSSIDFKIHESEEIQTLTGLRLRTWLINNVAFYVPKIYRKGNAKRKSRLFSELNMYTGYCMDLDFWKPFLDFISGPKLYPGFYSTNLEDLLNDSIYNCLNAIQDDVEGQQTEDYFSDFCEANGYEFTEDGKRI
jgi:hypothetical protein